MTMRVHNRPFDRVEQSALLRWSQIPVAVAVDVSHAACQIDPAIRPLCPAGQQPRLFGRAVTARCEPPDFGAVLYALEQIQPGDVLVIAAHGHAETAMIGEILGGHLQRRGGQGIVCDGAIRDVAQLAAMPAFSVFSRTITPRGPTSAERGEVNVAVMIGGRVVNPGDLLIGDDDGLAALDPAAIQRYIGDAEAKLAREAEWVAGLADGRSVMQTFGLSPAQYEPS